VIIGPKPLVLPVAGMDELILESEQGGHRFVARFVRKWLSGEARFDGPGEQLLGICNDEKLIAFAGLHADHYLGDPSVGRLRHLYVSKDFRRHGLGERLVQQLLDCARNFEFIRLRAGTPEASKFYDQIGWTRIDENDATHHWRF